MLDPQLIAFCRLALVQTPITDSAAFGSLAAAPPFVSCVFGTSITIEWTLTPFVALTPAAIAPAASAGSPTAPPRTTRLPNSSNRS